MSAFVLPMRLLHISKIFYLPLVHPVQGLIPSLQFFFFLLLLTGFLLPKVLAGHHFLNVVLNGFFSSWIVVQMRTNPWLPSFDPVYTLRVLDLG